MIAIKTRTLTSDYNCLQFVTNFHLVFNKKEGCQGECLFILYQRWATHELRDMQNFSHDPRGKSLE